MNRMIISNLAQRPIRSIISIVAVAIEVSMILLIVGLSLGMLKDSKTRQYGIGADVLVRPPGSSMMNAFNSASVSVKVADVLAKRPHVAAVAPVVMHVTSTTNIEIIYGIDLTSFEAVGGPFQYIHGGPFQGPDDMIVDDLFAASNKAKVGSTINLFNHDFHVCGIVPNGRGARRFIPMKTMQDLIEAPGKSSAFYVKLDNSQYADQAVQDFKAIPGMSEYSIMTMRDVVSLFSPDHIPMLNNFINAVVGIAMVIGFLVIFQSMYTAVMERTREIGILKSLGASKSYIVRVILRETLVLAIAGIVVGVILSFIASSSIRRVVPTMPVQFTGGWIVRAAIIAIVGAMIGAVYPAFKAAQKDPIDALAYE
ncbi:MAG TPA: FtsX-like permease family protein [Candidatus Angelobacter sp.]|nr:FtsX-like permease family protein [Candidatus Angelobacter sp.]